MAIFSRGQVLLSGSAFPFRAREALREREVKVVGGWHDRGNDDKHKSVSPCH